MSAIVTSLSWTVVAIDKYDSYSYLNQLTAIAIDQPDSYSNLNELTAVVTDKYDSNLNEFIVVLIEIDKGIGDHRGNDIIQSLIFTIVHYLTTNETIMQITQPSGLYVLGILGYFTKFCEVLWCF